MLSREDAKLKTAPTPDLAQTTISRYLLKLANSLEPALKTQLRNLNLSNAKSPRGQTKLGVIVRLGDTSRQVTDRFFSRGFQLEARQGLEKGLESRNQVLLVKVHHCSNFSKTKKILKL